jgi:hypothetical protein
LACISFLKTNLCTENAITILKQALFFDLYNLADDAMKIINHDATEILQSESFLEIDQQTLSTILQNDTLRIKEITIYKTVKIMQLTSNLNLFRLFVGPKHNVKRRELK